MRICLTDILQLMLGALQMVNIVLMKIVLQRAVKQLMRSEPLPGKWRAILHLLLIQQLGQLLQRIIGGHSPRSLQVLFQVKGKNGKLLLGQLAVTAARDFNIDFGKMTT